MEGISQALIDHGFAVVAAISLFGALTAVIKTLLTSISRSISDVQTQVEKSNDELRADLVARSAETHAVVIRLVDRVRSLDDSMVRLDVLVRLRSGDLIRDTDTLDRIGRTDQK